LKKKIDLLLDYLKACLDIGSIERMDCANALIAAILVIFTKISNENSNMKHYFGEKGLFSIILCNWLFYKAIINQDEHRSNEAKFEAIVLCGSLCNGSNVNRTLFGNHNGVLLLCQHLKSTGSSPSEREKRLLGVVDCIWSSVCGNRKNEYAFLHHQCSRQG
jgi:hypothetical protein